MFKVVSVKLGEDGGILYGVSVSADMSTGSRDPLPGKTEDRTHLVVCEEKKGAQSVLCILSFPHPGDYGV